jgi:WD40 repeat protein/class 3 adenylate cyclase
LTRTIGELQGTTLVRTFVIADIRGYTAFTRGHGDEAAARLAGRFAEVAREAAAARSGEVLELRGDEALAVFTSPSQAVRAAVELVRACDEEATGDGSLPLAIGVGIDVGDAVPVEGGFRGTALNTAARLCSIAAAGEIFATKGVVEAAGEIDGIRYGERRAAALKGFDAPVEVVRVSAPDRHPVVPTVAVDGAVPSLAPELDTFTPLVDRIEELRWLRGTWRQVRRGEGRVLLVSGPPGIGKTRLIAEVAHEVYGRAGVVEYTGAGGAGTALALQALREARAAERPTVLLVDDLDSLGDDVVALLDETIGGIADRPVMVVATVRTGETSTRLSALVQRADERGDGHRELPSLDESAVAEIARLYTGPEAIDGVPLESVIRASSGVPARVHEVMSDWARNEARRRLAAAAEYLATGRTKRSADLEFANNVIALKLGRLYSAVGTAGAATGRCPYKGLAPFASEDSSYFFGRERLIGELAARTVGAGLLGVVGASGSGKSSAVMAGLVPSLSAGLLPGSERWRPVVMRPGGRPFEALRSALNRTGVAVDGGDPLAAVTVNGLGGERLVLIVDQFEELFDPGIDPAERDAFLGSLVRAAAGDPERLVVVPTLRGDFYDRLAAEPALAALFADNHVLLGPMRADELRRAIEFPARRAGLHVESALTDALVAEVEDEPGGLPLLSTALAELWAARERGWLTFEAYERTGGVRGAVARLAERSFGRLSEVEQEAARRILLRLVGAPDGDTVVRRRVSTAEFELDRDPLAWAVLERFTQDRLLTRSDGWVEVSHEALIREWPRLAAWLDEDLEGQRVRAHLAQTAKQWDERDREPGDLYRGARLSTTLDWAAAHGPELNELERTFLSQSRLVSEREAERQRRTNRRLRAMLTGVVVLLVAATVAGVVAIAQRGRAERERRIAFARELASAAEANLQADPERSMLLAMEAVRQYRRAGVTVKRDAIEALHRGVQESRGVTTLDDPSTANAAFSPDGRLVATGGSVKGTEQFTVVLWDARSGRIVRELEGHTGDVNDLNFSPDGSRLATVAADRTAIVWEVASGDRLLTLRDHDDVLQGVSFSNDGSLVATSGWDGVLRIWDAEDGELVRAIRTGVGLCYNAFAPDDRTIGVGACIGDTGTVWDVATGRLVTTLRGHDGGVVGVFFAPNGRRVATGSLDGTAAIWDVRTGRRLLTLRGHVGWVFATPFSPDGRTIASAGTDGTIRLWDARTGQETLVLSGHGGSIGDVAWAPDGTRIVTGGADATAKVWDVTPAGSRDWLTLVGHGASVSSVAFSADGARLVTAGADGTARLWDAATGDELARFEGPSTTRSAELSADGSRLITTGELPVVWDVASRRRALALEPIDDASSYPSVAFSPDERFVAVGGAGGAATVFDAETGGIVRTFQHSEQPDVAAEILGIAFSPDGSELATASGDGTAKVWSLESGDLLRTLRGHQSRVHSIMYNADGRSLVTSSGDGVAIVWDDVTGRPRATLRGHTGFLWDAELSPDGRTVATAGEDATVRLWHASTGRETLKLDGHSLAVHDVAFSLDGRYLASASADGTVRVSFLRLPDLMRAAADRVSRTFTEAECRQYLHVRRCPAATG